MTQSYQEFCNQIGAIIELKDNWFNGVEGTAYKKDELLLVKESFSYLKGNLLPFIYPTVEGDVYAEWSLNKHEISLEIDTNTMQAKWYCLNMLTNEDNTRILDLEIVSHWIWMAAQLEFINRKC